MLAFHKMHGCGNDFVVIDARHKSLSLTADQIKRLADRHLGIGCDQVVLMKEGQETDVVDCHASIYNADGSEGGVCGNATRCLGQLLWDRKKGECVMVGTQQGVWRVDRIGDERYRVETGVPEFRWQSIPLSQACAWDHLPIKVEGLTAEAIVALSMGNPHCVIVSTPQMLQGWLASCSGLEHHALFPERANIGCAVVHDRQSFDLQVWERGVGFTQACGTGACAAGAALIKLGLVDSPVQVKLPGGVLEIAWLESDTKVIMSGPTHYTFQGAIDVSSLLAGT